MTSLTSHSLPEVDREAIRFTRMSYAIAVAALLIPGAAALMGHGSAFSFGASLAGNLLLLAFLMGLTWLFTRGRGETAKSKGRLLAALALFMVVAFGAIDAVKKEKQAKDIGAQILQINNQSETEMADFSSRFMKFEPASVLTVRNLTSTQGLAVSRARLAEYRSLLSERKTLVSGVSAKMGGVISTMPIGQLRDVMLSSMQDQKRKTAEVYEALDVAQAAQADAMDRVIAWAEGAQGQLRMNGGQLQFSSEAQRQSFVKLAQDLDKADAEVLRQGELAAARQATLLEKRSQSKRELEALVSQ